ncbi:meiotic recombination protein REC8 homolog [Strongylocentrotus purpuratus]|uniref:Meiotic recombination protein REC8 homolog n=1 Tax=Strongylocentrotus purpuratus TaxID=7668 RepID=A0A7M7SZ45_STRPU|nr:meiotic recombination protein REC8 homolog [Strongylocentrotus purpuratus]
MFYSHDILQKRGGKFGIIWIAATKGVALSKRDYCSVCVPKSCDDIVKYITLEAMPVSRKGSRPRFSLYLSSQLMVGVARVFEKQVNYFIVDVNELHKRTTGFRASSFDDVYTSHIQLKKSTKSGDFCTMPESNMFNDEEFGLMRGSWDLTPDPLLLPQIEMFSVSPYRTAKLSTSLLELSPTQMDKLVLESPPHLVSSASEISLRDEVSHNEEMQIPEVELPPLEGIDDDLMTTIYEEMAIAEEMKENEEKDNLSQISSFCLDQLWEVDQRTGQLILSPSPKGTVFQPRHSSSPHRSLLLDQLSPIPSQEELLPSPTGPGVQDGVPMVEDIDLEFEGAELAEVAPPSKKPSSNGMETPGTGPVMLNILRLSPIDSASPTPVPRRGRKRRLVFADDSTQLSKKDIRHNMETVGELARKETFISPSHPSAKELFEEPARKALKKTNVLYKLWKNHSALRTVTTDPEADDIDAPAWSTAYMRPRPPMPGSSSDTTSKEGQEEEEEDERALLLKEIPEVLRHEISVSPERLRDISLETSQPRTKFEDTPHSLIVSDASHLSESKDSSRVKSFHSDPPTAHRSLHRPTGDSFKEMEEAIQEELMDIRELPLLPEEDIMMDQLEEQLEEPAVPSAPEMISTSEDEEMRKAKKKTKTQTETTVPQDNILKGIGVLTEEVDSISFKDLVPPRTYRSVAVKIFSVCLEYAAMRLITLTQDRPFGDIYIQRGPNFD